MKEKILITKNDLCKFHEFVEEKHIILDCDDVYPTSIYFNDCSVNHLSWNPKIDAADKTLKRVVKILNAIMLSNHELIYVNE